MLNTIAIMGRFCSPAIPRGTAENLGASFTLAVPRNYKNSAGERETDFIDCIAFGKLGEFILGNFQKGSRAVVQGSLRIGTYVNQDGKNCRSCSVVVNDIYFADAPPCAAAAAPQAAAAATQAAAAADPWEYPFT